MFELFSGRGNNPIAHWKLCGGPAAIRRVSFLTSAFSLFAASFLSFGIDTFPSEQQRTVVPAKGRLVITDESMSAAVWNRYRSTKSTMLKMNQKMECC